MKLLIIGGSSFVGSGILKYVSRDWQVAGTWLTHPLVSGSVACFQLDVRDSLAVDRVFADVMPDVVIHTAALMQGEAMLATNAQGSGAIARAARRFNSRLIHISSDVIFDGEHAPYSESAAASPITPYGRSKAIAEQLVRQEHGQAVIVRTSLIYGLDPLDPRTQQTLDGEMPNLFTDEFRCPILVDDFARALVELASLNYFGVLNIAGPQRISRYDFGVKLAHAFGIEPRFRAAVSASGPTPRPRDCTLDTSLAKGILHTPIRGVDQVLAERAVQPSVLLD